MNNELWLIWKQNTTRRRYKVGTLSYEKQKYNFTYQSEELEDASKAGFDCFPGFPDKEQVYTSKELFTNIKTRLPNPQRPDYLHILNKYSLTSQSSALDILAKTKGRLITDTYEFVKAFNKNEIEFDIAGISHCKDYDKIKENLLVNDKIELETEKENKYDTYAIKITITKEKKKYHLGYVPRYYSKELYTILKEKKAYSALIKNLSLDNEMYDKDMIISIRLIIES